VSSLSDLNLSESAKQRVKENVGDFLVESVLQTLRKAESPVAGESFAPLSPKYKKFKMGEGDSGTPNMELYGDMLDSLTYKETDDGIELGFFDSEAWKADGHNKFSGEENNTPQRRFLPAEGDKFVSNIQNEVNKIIADAIAEDTTLKADDFSAVTSKASLYDVLETYFADYTDREIKMMVLRNPEMMAFLDEEGLAEYL